MAPTGTPAKADLAVTVERWPIRGRFAIARGSKTEAVVVVATVSAAGFRGRGECVPYARYGETVERVVDELEAMRRPVGEGLDRSALLHLMPAGAARNALDCALWDIEAKRTGVSACRRAGINRLRPLETAFTISLAGPAEMAASAATAAHRPLLKVKLGGPDDRAAIAAVRQAAPRSRLVVDANEGWRAADLAANLAACAAAGVELVEQPLPASSDEALAEADHVIPICADESLGPGAGLDALADRYDAVNIKLDKTGGLTAALALHREAKAAGFKTMIGCMVATSLSMAPAFLLANDADFVDLDGPLLLDADRDGGLRYDGSLVFPPEPTLWG